MIIYICAALQVFKLVHMHCHVESCGMALFMGEEKLGETYGDLGAGQQVNMGAARMCAECSR